MFEKWYQPLLPLGGASTKALWINEGIFYLSMDELFPSFPLSVLCHPSSRCLPTSSTLAVSSAFSPFPPPSPDIKPWLWCESVRHSNIIHCFKLKDSHCFSSFHHFVAVGPFPLYVPPVQILGLLPFFWYLLKSQAVPSSRAPFCAVTGAQHEYFVK